MSSGDLAKVPYDYSAIAPAGSTLFTAGACPLDSDGQVAEPGDHEGQANRVIDNLLHVLADNGAGAEDLVRTTVYVVGTREDLVSVWQVVAARLAPCRPPSTLVGVTVLGYPDQLVEVDGVAVLPGQAG
jgi:enamine deaminase RidA (YjgF/YER057c/UK114 family)